MRRGKGAAATIRHRYEQEEILASVGSLTGRQMEQLADGRAPGGGVGDGLARRIASYMDSVKLCSSLTEEEEQVCRLRFLGRLPSRVEVEACRRFTSQPTTIESYERPEWDHNALDGSTYLGEIPLPGREGMPEEMVRMVGLRARLTTFAEIADEMGGALTARQVQSRFESACAKVGRALRERQEREEDLKERQRPQRQEADTIQKPPTTDPTVRRLYNRAQKCSTCWGKRVVTINGRLQNCPCQKL